LELEPDRGVTGGTKFHVDVPREWPGRKNSDFISIALHQHTDQALA
jgi:hypothetical protein